MKLVRHWHSEEIDWAIGRAKMIASVPTFALASPDHMWLQKTKSLPNWFHAAVEELSYGMTHGKWDALTDYMGAVAAGLEGKDWHLMTRRFTDWIDETYPDRRTGQVGQSGQDRPET